MRVEIRRGLAAAVATLALGASGVAHAANLTAFDVKTVVSALQGNGYQAKLDKGDDGSPLIISGAGGNSFVIIFSSCANPGSCEYMEIISSYTEVKDSVAQGVMKAWQGTENFSGVLYVPKEHRISLYHYVITGKEGISADSLTATITYFMRDFGQLGDMIVKGH